MDPGAGVMHLRSTSSAEDVSYVALADASTLAQDDELRPVRIIGGQMVELLMVRHGLDVHRDTRDADLGFHARSLQTPLVVERLRGLGYEKTSGARFARVVQDVAVERGAPAPPAATELRGAATPRNVRQSVTFGTPPHLGVTEVRGLAYAFKRPPITIEAALERRSGEVIEARLELPDEAAALVVKVGAWQSRNEARDAFDVYRCLLVAREAGVTAADLSDGAAVEQVDQLVADFGSRGAPGLDALAAYPASVAADERRVQTRATIKALLG